MVLVLVRVVILQNSSLGGALILSLNKGIKRNKDHNSNRQESKQIIAEGIIINQACKNI